MLLEKAVTLVLVTAIVGVGAVSLEGSASTDDASPATEVGIDLATPQEMPTPGPEHKWIARRAGKWNVSSKFRMTPDMPWMESKASETATMICGGFWLSAEFAGNVAGMKFTGRQQLGYDQHKKKFVSTWIDSMGSHLIYSTGTLSDDKKTLSLAGESFDPMSGKMVKTSMVVNIKSENESVMKMYGPGPDGKDFCTMELHYERAK